MSLQFLRRQIEMMRDRWSWTRPLAVSLFAGYVIIAAAPSPTVIVSPTLDGSWMYEINRLAASRGGFGADVAFTYGPLGFLIHPIDLASNLLVGIAFRATVHLATAVLMAIVAFRSRAPLRAACAAAILAIAVGFGLPFEYQVLVPVLLLCWIAVDTEGCLALAGAAALAATMLFAKTSLGIGAAAIVLMATVLWALRGGPALVRTAILVGVAYLLAFGVVSASIFNTPVEALGWLKLSLETAAEYSVAMSYPGPARDLRAAGVVLAAYAAAVGASLRARSRETTFLTLAAGPVFVAFKHAFVRHDPWHVVSFFPFLVVVAGLALLHAGPRRWSRIGFAAVSIVTCAWIVPAQGLGYTPASLVRSVVGTEGYDRVFDLNLRTVRHRNQAGWASLEKDSVPGLAERAAGRSVGVVPSELTYCAANRLHCVPNPLLQLYQTFTASHDELTARHYSGPRAPDFLLAHHQTIDGRNLILDTPATWRAILAWYEIAPWQPSPELVILERRSSASVAPAVFIQRTEVEADRWIAVPPTDGDALLSAHVEFALSARGRIAKALYRVPPVYMDVLHCDGRESTHRIMPDTARNGLMVSDLPTGSRELRAFLAGDLANGATRIRFHGPGLRHYRTPLPVTWTGQPRKRPAAACVVPTFDAAGLRAISPPDGAPLLYVDEMNSVRDPLSRSEPIRIGLASDPVLRLRGWAVDPIDGKPARGVFVVSRDKSAWVPTGDDRSDVANHFRVPGYAMSGFGRAIPMDIFGPGVHELRFVVVSANGKSYFDPHADVTVVIENR